MDKNDAEIAIGKWLSAALEDENTCAEMKKDIVNWFTFKDYYLATLKCIANKQEPNDTMTLQTIAKNALRTKHP